MLPDRVSNPEPLTYESGALPIALRGPAMFGSALSYQSTVVPNRATIFVEGISIQHNSIQGEWGITCSLLYEGGGGLAKLNNKTWPRGYKTFFMLNSIEHEILNAY